MNAKQTSWVSQRPSATFWGTAVLLLLALLATAGIKSYRDLATTRLHEAELAARIAATQERIRVLDLKVEKLSSDPHTLERIAREDLGLVRPEDVVIFLPPEPNQTPPPATTVRP